MRKNKIILIFIAIFLVATLNFMSAQLTGIQYPQCCSLAKNGAQCVAVPASECASNFAPTSCDNVPSCQKGVCVNIQSGECVESTPKSVCENSGGLFKTEPIHKILECQLGCCILGQDTLFSTEIACKEAASKEGLNFNFREDITSANTCLGLSLTDEEGACVIKTQFETKCKRTTGKECSSKDSGNFTGLLENSVSGTSLTTEFHQGKLCAADELKTDCTKSEKTTCYKDDVYYLDTCGNRANIFNSAKYNDPLNSEYWTYIKEPSEVCSPVVGGSSSAKTCGNCDYSSSSKCRVPQSEDPSPLNQQANFKNICGDLRCKYNGKTYQNTESWCAQTPGTPWQEGGPGIEVNLNGEYITSKDKMFDPTKYNLPGSRYVVQECYDGEVLEVACKDQREQVCKQYEQQGRTKAVCEYNNPRACFMEENQNKNKCNDLSDCYWLSGSSPIIGGNIDEGAVQLGVITEEEIKEQGLNLGRFPDDEREQKQGSCVPLFTPGNSFWTENGQAYCRASEDSRRVIYDIQITQDREEFISNSEVSGEKWSYTGKSDNYKRQTRCSGNCFAIPNFGGINGKHKDIIAALWNGEKRSDWTEQMPISDRKGQYCHKKDKPDKLKSGAVVGNKVSCADDDGDDTRFNKPEFYTHSTWLKFIGIRARASGDCGVTTNFLGENPSYDSEKITTTIQKIKQDQSSTKPKWEGEVVEGILYKGKDLEDLNNPIFNGAIYPGTSESAL